MLSPEAVIFDMDGVIFDSERAVIECWKIVAQQEGVPDIEEHCRRALGINAEATRKLWYEMYGDKFPYEELAAKRRALVQQMFERGEVAIKPGVIELLTYLRENGIKTAIASSTSSPSVLREIKGAGLFGYFDEIVCGDMVKNSKPAPDIWLEALKRLGADSALSMGIEDSFNGVKSAKAAGLYTIMVPDLIPPDDELRATADIVLPSLNEVLELVSKTT